MASATKGTKELFILTTLSIWFSLVYSVLNVEELNSVQYGFEILNEPVLVKEVSFRFFFFCTNQVVKRRYEK